MSTTIAWLFSITLIAAWLVVSLRFRKGRHRAYLRWYRNPGSPIAFRNFPIVSPIVMGLLFPWLLAAGPILLPFETDIEIAPATLKLVALVGGAYFFLLIAATAFLLYRVPRWLIPRWLREDDDRIGYVPAPADWFDKLLLGGFGSIGLVLGLILLASAIGALWPMRA